MSPPALDAESSQSSSGYEDGLGRRVLAFDRETGDMLERLVLRPELCAFEAALRERLTIVAGLDDERFMRPRDIERGADDRLIVVSENVAGRRLSDVLDAAAESGIIAGLDAGLGLLLELLPALARLHDEGLAHGVLAPGRVMITAAGQLVLLDSIYAEPLERLKLTRRRLWSEFRLAFPASAGAARFDKAADLGHAAMIAAALIVGRPLRDDDYPDGIPALRQEILEIASIRGSKTFADAVNTFFGGTLPLAGRRAKAAASADEAAIDLRKLVRKELGINACRTALLEFFQQVETADAERMAADAAADAALETDRIAAQVAADAARLEAERADAERRDEEQARERAEKARLKAERLEAERIEKERAHQARIDAERAEKEHAERARLEAEEAARAEAERIAGERAEAARLERERLERENAEKARLEAERLERERAEQVRLEAERQEQERLERERAEKARLEAERLERERAEKARIEAERLEKERLERERAEKARLEAERLEKERLERERAEKARLEAERLEKERLERERAEKARLEAERLEKERLERERAEKARLEAERLEKERLERERAEKARLEAERLERERAEKARIEAERLERERIENERRERVARERAEKARIELERAEKARLEAERLDRERAEAQRRELELLEAARAERERAEKARLEAERLEQERAERARLEAEREEQEEMRERAERARIEAERLAAEERELERERELSLAREQALQREQDEKRKRRESEGKPAPAAPAAASWLVPPDRAAKFEPVVSDPPPAAVRPYPIYVPPAEPPSWTPDPQPPPAPMPTLEPVAAASAPSAAIGFAKPAGGAGAIRLKDTPVRDFGSSSIRADHRHEPESMSAEGAYEPFGTNQTSQPVPWKLIAAGVVLIAATFAIFRGYTPASVPLMKTVRAVAPAATPAPAKPPSAGEGRLAITTQPAGARVTVDGKAIGETPLTVDTVSPGRHVIVVTAASGASAKRTVRVEAGKTVTLDLPLFSGFAAISAPFVVDVSENGKVLGTSGDQILLTPGRHELRLSNKELEYVASETVEVQAGDVTRLSIDPRGRANINAAPWAEVWIDGEKAGDTPLANVAIRLGVREIVFKNPQFGERKVTATITASTPATISIDFNK